MSTEEEIFWSKVDIRSPNECWEWRGARFVRGGYGIFKCAGTPIAASRWIMQHLHGLTLDSLTLVRHTCDNPPCCNPNHLVLGNHTDNAMDAVASGRMGRARGNRNANAKLTPAIVRSVRARYTGTIGEKKQFANEYGVDPKTMAKAIDGRNWSWVL